MSLEDRSKNTVALDGQSIPPLKEVIIVLRPNQMPLNNQGDDVRLIDASGSVQHTVTYESHDVVPGQPIQFG